MSSDLRFQGQANAWDSTIGWIVYTLRQFRPGDVFEMGPRDQMVYPETDSGVPCLQAQLLRDNVVWLRLSDRPLILPNVFDLDAARMALDVWNYDDLPEDCTAGEFFSDDHGRIAEACVAWFRDRQGITEPGTLGCEFHFSPYREPTLGEEGNTDSLSSVVRRIESLAADSELELQGCFLTVGTPEHSIDIQVEETGELKTSETTTDGVVHCWPDRDEILDELNTQLSTIQCSEHPASFDVVIESTLQLSNTTPEELRDLVVRVGSARDLICGEYDFDTEDSEVQTIIDWRAEHHLASYEDVARFEAGHDEEDWEEQDE